MRIFFIFLLLPLKMFSQDIEGVWTGTIYNDTTRKYIPYEIVISESKGKLSGYSHTTFIDNNREVTGVKSLKIKQKNTKILIEDDELIYNNYSEPPPKGVKQYSVLNVMQGESGLLLVGVFNTNRTKEYASLTGTIHLQKKENITDSKIISKLDQLQLSSSLSFIQKKEKEQLAIAEERRRQEDGAHHHPADPSEWIGTMGKGLTKSRKPRHPSLISGICQPCSENELQSCVHALWTIAAEFRHASGDASCCRRECS